MLAAYRASALRTRGDDARPGLCVALAVYHPLGGLGVPFAVGRDLRGGVLDLADVVPLDSSTAAPPTFFFQAIHHRRPRNRHDPRIAGEQQGEGDLGRRRVLLFGDVAAQSPLVSVNLSVEARVVEVSPAHPCLMVRVALDPAVVGDLLADGLSPPPGRPSRGLGVSPVAPALWDAVYRLVALLDSAYDIGLLSPLVLREITYRVPTGPQGGRLRQIASDGAPAQRIARAIRWLKDHFAEPLRVDSLAGRVGMSPSAFRLHFKGVTTLSPLQYQKRLRLQEARRLMLGAGIEAVEAAFRVGYESSSQFSREYRRLFRAPPCQDVAELRVEVV